MVKILTIASSTVLIHKDAIPTRGIGMSVLALLFSSMSAGMAWAGGYVAPIIDLPPAAPALTAGSPQSWWLALIPFLLLALVGRGGGRDNGLTPLPPDYGGSCFGEKTLVRLERGWVPVEEIKAGERVVTSRGVQTILWVDSWRPVDYRDRPSLVEGVRLSPNHGVAADGIIVPACKISSVRSKIDGSHYFHILVKDHSWLFAKADTDAVVIQAESLCVTADLKLAKKFPELVGRHATDPVSPVRVEVKDCASRMAA